MLSIENNNYWL